MSRWKWGVSTVDTAPESAPLLLQGTVEENLIKAGALGFDAIEIHTRETVDWNLNRIKHVMETTGVRIAQIVTGKLNTEGHCSLTSDRPYVTEACLKGMKSYIDLAGALSADIVLGWIRGNVPPGCDSGKYRNRLAKNLRILSAYGAERGVKINIEVINHYETNLFNTSEELADFLTEYDLQNCFIHLDSYHMMLEETDFRKAIRTAGNRLGYFHVADSTRWYPGSGNLDLSAIMDALKEIEYDGYVTIECFRHGDGEATAEKGLEYLKQITA